MWAFIKQALSLLLGLVLVGALGYALFALIREAIRTFASLDKTVEASIITAGATIVAVVITVALGNIYASRQQNERANRNRRVPVYERLLEFTFRFVGPTEAQLPVPEQEVAAFMRDFNQQFMVWASDSVLAAFIAWRRFFSNEAAVRENPQEGMFLFEDIIFAIRRDLGHGNKSLKTGDVLRLFVNDVDNWLPRRRLS